MQRGTVRTAVRTLRPTEHTPQATCPRRRRPRARLLALSAATAALALINATPANAAVIWDGDASHGSGVFGTFLCDEGNHVYTPDWNDGRGLIWGFVNKAGNARCEAHTVNTDGSEYQFTGTQSHPYWFGWEIMTTQAPSIVFQWKSNGNDDQHNQNYPLLLQVNAGYLHVWYIAPGEVWNKIGQAPLAAGTWHRLQLGILARPDTTGSIQVHLDGTQVANAPNARTWDVLGNKPRWGVYDSKLATTEQIHWANDLKLGTTRADAD